MYSVIHIVCVTLIAIIYNMYNIINTYIILHKYINKYVPFSFSYTSVDTTLENFNSNEQLSTASSFFILSFSKIILLFLRKQ